MEHPQNIRDHDISPEAWAMFRRCRFEPRTFDSYPCLSTIDGSVWEPYRGQPFNPAELELVADGWDHEHCDVCSARITDGAAYWTNAGQEHVDLCVECYPFVRAVLDAELGTAADIDRMQAFMSCTSLGCLRRVGSFDGRRRSVWRYQCD